MTNTSSRATYVVGWASVIALVIAAAFALWLSPPEVNQGDAVRLMYLHLPTIAVSYIGFGITFLGSVIYLRNGSVFWDLLAGAAAEVGVLFTALLLITGALWGKPTWGTYWEWDPRLTATTVMFIMYIGYLAIRRLELPQEVRSRRAAVLGIISIINLIIVRYSVQWWRGLHQGVTIDAIDTQIDGLMLFTLFLSVIAFIIFGAWLLIHRFRVAWLERQVEDMRLARALVERRAESGNANADWGMA